MTPSRRPRPRRSCAATTFSRVGVLADIGGGQGELFAAISAANPHLRGVLWDMPSVLAGAPPSSRRRGRRPLPERGGGTSLKPWPAGAEAYLPELDARCNHVPKLWCVSRAAPLQVGNVYPM